MTDPRPRILAFDVFGTVADWHRLSVWPDVVEGLARLRRAFICTTLSNGNISLLTEQARHAGTQWGRVLSAEVSGKYKPDTYLGVARLFDLAPSRW